MNLGSCELILFQVNSKTGELRVDIVARLTVKLGSCELISWQVNSETGEL